MQLQLFHLRTTGRLHTASHKVHVGLRCCQKIPSVAQVLSLNFSPSECPSLFISLDPIINYPTRMFYSTIFFQCGPLSSVIFPHLQLIKKTCQQCNSCGLTVRRKRVFRLLHTIRHHRQLAEKKILLIPTVGPSFCNPFMPTTNQERLLVVEVLPLHCSQAVRSFLRFTL